MIIACKLACKLIIHEFLLVNVMLVLGFVNEGFEAQVKVQIAADYSLQLGFVSKLLGHDQVEHVN